MTFKAAIKYLQKPAYLSGLALLASSQVSAAVLDWSIYRSDYTPAGTSTYTDPAARNSGTMWNGTASTPGNVQVLQKTLVNVNSTGVDIRVTVTGNTSAFASDTTNSLGVHAPQVSHLSWDPNGNGLRDSETNTFNNPLALVLDLDHTDWDQSVTVTFDFFNTGTSTPRTVENVTYEIYDLDAASADSNNIVTYIDEVRNFTTTFNGASGGSPTLQAGATNTVGTSPYDLSENVGGGQVFNNTTTLYGLGTNLPTAKAGHASAVYSSILMQSMSLTYGNYNVFDSGTFEFNDPNSPYQQNALKASNQPVQQIIGIGNIVFTATPESGTVIGYAAALGCLGLVFNRRRKR